MDLRPLHPDFGVEVTGVDLRDATADHLYPGIRDAFERHSLLLFRNQNLAPRAHQDLAGLFGPIEVRSKDPREKPKLSMVSNRDAAASLSHDDRLRLLNLQSNFLWHTDSTFLPVPALANILAAKVVTSTGGETELVSTRAGWRRLPEETRERLRRAVFLHRYAHSRAKISKELAEDELFTMWPDQAWRAVWPNPVTGEEALYIASHVYGVRGMEPREGESLVEELMAKMTPPEAIYAHRWEVGDVLIWDERATLHRGRPWPYEEERSLASFCVSVTAADGL
jgi:alpha-ketoglutarate-dependent 2,4-dichlorophenoxyacetate dioxygenase